MRSSEVWLNGVLGGDGENREEAIHKKVMDKVFIELSELRKK